MQRKTRPALDPTIEPQQGMTRDGQPLSYNRAPSPDLAPWLGRLYVTKVDLPEDYTLSCGLFTDTSTVRIQLAGNWVAQTVDGQITTRRGAFYFGPHSRRMPISVTGSFISVGFAIRPGTGTSLNLPHVGKFVDRIVSTDALSGPEEDFMAALKPEASPEEWLQAIEDVVRGQIKELGGALPNPLAARFEEISLRNPAISVSDAAEECGVDRRKLERVVSRDFGMPPKQVLRRARALDMASHLRGVADSREGDEIALRYYDESHLIHEFTELFGMSPRRFVTRPQPILTLALESRQARRLEALHRLEPGQARPWE
ncbi:helix-turn-helix transcriptional regulator [Novosphingobium guangzhouense]|uniref:AraC family transcriptional regulator n=1 Tax=Novosphingobium guangzhouense TaxID=1850347 RepID=A0A2K2FY63_9SPHN|nr:helix-turn-helix domain-containing protein [Novosphingobium guangzhouense]PNU03698.1 AraC family transcriptional regulator [Novosphingobium guangzhouense]